MRSPAPTAMTLLKDRRPEDGQRVIARLADGTATFRATYWKPIIPFILPWGLRQARQGRTPRRAKEARETSNGMRTVHDALPEDGQLANVRLDGHKPTYLARFRRSNSFLVSRWDILRETGDDGRDIIIDTLITSTRDEWRPAEQETP